MKLPYTIIHPIPMVITDRQDRYNAMNKVGPVHTIYDRKPTTVATICYSFVPEGVLYGATLFRKETETEHWDKKKSRRLALDRLAHAPIYLAIPTAEPWKDMYLHEFEGFRASFLRKRGFAGLHEYTKDPNNIVHAWNATIKHAFAKRAIRKTMHTHGCWQKNATLTPVVLG